MWLILSANPSWLQAAAESPPPMIVVASVSASAFATAIVPLASVGFSNTPIGPFQTTVLASLAAVAKSSCVLGPISRPSLSAGILVESTYSTAISASIGLGKPSATAVSIGRRSFLPSFSALAIISLQ